MKYKLSLFLLILFCTNINAQTFYDLNTIQTIEITFAQSNWDALLDAAEVNDAYIPAQSISINGTVLTNVGVKYKGNSSYNANQVKNPVHIELDAYVNQNYQGYTDIKLSNVFKDPSFVREALAYKMLKNYMHAPLANFAKLYINGSYIGLYTNIESVSKKFVNNHFGSNNNAFFDCSPPAGAGPGVTNLPNLSYLGTDFTSYESAYDMKSTTGWDDLINLTNVLNNNINEIETVLDVDRALWMLAFDNLLVNLDSYIGAFKQNYYIYKDNNGRFNPIIWDLNESFGTFANTGSSTLNTTTQKAQMSHTLHSNETAWPLVQKLLAVPTYKKRYLAHYKTILNEMIVSGLYLTDAQAIQTLISASVATDTNKFSYQSNITTNLNTDVSIGMGSASGLSALMNSRKTYLQAQADFTNTQPNITSINTSNNNPPIGSTITFTANVTNTNTNGVYLGYRSTADGIFTKVLMYDDGNHNDGASGDNVYGANVTITGITTQYYIYAENNNVGKFSPERAEHEFYTLTATYPTINPGDLVINEIMAQNTVTVTDADGEYEDWFELYNNSNNTLSLDNLYATDTSSNMLKWQFPSGLTIEPNSYLVVWADQDLTQSGIHADFKFSAAGERCILSYPNGTIVDTVTFGAQTTDMGYARIPNGTGNFVIQAPTFNANNESLNTPSFSAKDIKLYPNPVDTVLNIDAPATIHTIQLYSSLGQLLIDEEFNSNQIELNLSKLGSGVYLLKVNNCTSKIILKK